MARWTVDGPRRLTLTEPVRRLDVRLVAGRLNVVGTDGPARLEITAVGRRPVVVTQIDGTLRVELENPRGPWPWAWLVGPAWWLRGNRRHSADVSVAVPHHTPATLRLVHGSLVVSGLRAGAEAEVTHGRITLLGVAGRTAAKVVSGPVEALGVGGELDLETVSGELVVAESTARRVRARTISGPITVDLDNPRREDEIRLETISGEITVRVREDSDLQVQMHAVSGRVTSAFAGLGQDSMPGRRGMRGVLGSGAGRLWAYATSGNIALLHRRVDQDAEPDGADRAAAGQGGEELA